MALFPPMQVNTKSSVSSSCLNDRVQGVPGNPLWPRLSHKYAYAHLFRIISISHLSSDHHKVCNGIGIISTSWIISPKLGVVWVGCLCLPARLGLGLYWQVELAPRWCLWPLRSLLSSDTRLQKPYPITSGHGNFGCCRQVQWWCCNGCRQSGWVLPKHCGHECPVKVPLGTDMSTW